MGTASQLMCLALVTALGLCLLAGFPVAFTLAGVSLLFAVAGGLAGLFDWSFLTAFPQGVFSVITSEVLVAVPLFVFMGAMLERSGVAEDLLEGVGDLFGAAPGGLAIAISLVGALVAASTGIVGATVVTMGLMSLPVMLARGYNAGFACGSVAASGTLGQIIPPSIVLILLADQISAAWQNAQFSMGVFAPDTVSVTDFFAGALLPGLMLAGLYVCYQVAYGLFRPDRAPGRLDARARREPPRPAALAGALFPPVALIVAVLGSILAGLASPSEAAALGAVGAVLIAAWRKVPAARAAVALGAASGAALVALAALFDLRLQRAVVPAGDMAAILGAVVLTAVLCLGAARALAGAWAARDQRGTRVLVAVLETTIRLTAMIFMIVIAARLFAIVFRGFGGDQMIEAALTGLPGGTAGAVLAVMAAMFLMGFFLEFLEIVFIVVPVVAPVLLQMEMVDGSAMSPVWLGVMMAVNLQTSFLTPPFGFALFYLRGVAPESVGTRDIYLGVAPFVLLQLAALALLWFFPALATWLPSLLS